MILFDNKENVIKYFIYISVLMVILFFFSRFFYKERIDTKKNEISTSTIVFNEDNTQIYAEYPRFNKNDKVNKIVTDMLYSYIKKFKQNNKNKILDITYSIYNINKYVNIVFNIEDTTSNIKNKNILIDLKNNTIAYITSLYNEEYLKNEILSNVENKYSNDILKIITGDTINNFTYIISDEKMDVFFNNNYFDNVDYVPFITINFVEQSSSEYDDNKEKYIALTFDDGPSEYTDSILKALNAYNSSATFFMIGNKMKKYKEVVSKIYESNSEIASHGYNHKDLTKLSLDEIYTEVNTTNIIFNDITNDNLSLLRPPYGKYDENVLNLGYKIILWNIDTKDWLIRNENIIYNNIIKNACDGCIILMHDTYKESLEATKKILPSLQEKGFNIVSVSKLLEIKGYSEDKSVISYVK